jgi:hypothetical protein
MGRLLSLFPEKDFQQNGSLFRKDKDGAPDRHSRCVLASFFQRQSQSQRHACMHICRSHVGRGLRQGHGKAIPATATGGHSFD